uniref:Uncharacterized protein n=1 Tax=Oryza nivara TaxID=4536 RepID=A0A0E0GJG3_ORYNI
MATTPPCRRRRWRLRSDAPLPRPRSPLHLSSLLVATVVAGQQRRVIRTKILVFLATTICQLRRHDGEPGGVRRHDGVHAPQEPRLHRLRALAGVVSPRPQAATPQRQRYQREWRR